MILSLRYVRLLYVQISAVSADCEIYRGERANKFDKSQLDTLLSTLLTSACVFENKPVRVMEKLRPEKVLKHKMTCLIANFYNPDVRTVIYATCKVL